METENPRNEDDPQRAKLWEQKLNIPTIRLYLKKGGS